MAAPAPAGSPSPPSVNPVPRKAAAYGLAVMTLLNFVNYIDRFVLPAVGPKIKAELNLTDAQLGLLGSAFLFSYLLTSPIFGRMGDRGSRTRLMAVGVAVWSLATAAGGAARNLTQMFFARGAVGVGEALVRDDFADAHRRLLSAREARPRVCHFLSRDSRGQRRRLPAGRAY